MKSLDHDHREIRVLFLNVVLIYFLWFIC